MDLTPLREFVARHGLETAPEWSLLDVLAQLGELSRAHLKQSNFGQENASLPTELAHEKLGDLMFAVAYLCSLYDVDPEAALWDSVRRFEAKLEK